MTHSLDESFDQHVLQQHTEGASQHLTITQSSPCTCEWHFKECFASKCFASSTSLHRMSQAQLTAPEHVVQLVMHPVNG